MSLLWLYTLSYLCSGVWGSSPALWDCIDPVMCCVFLSLAESKLHRDLQCLVKPDLCSPNLAELSLMFGVKVVWS